jgi:hypothetical protein
MTNILLKPALMGFTIGFCASLFAGESIMTGVYRGIFMALLFAWFIFSLLIMFVVCMGSGDPKSKPSEIVMIFILVSFVCGLVGCGLVALALKNFH